jgi:hypothetical protein
MAKPLLIPDDDHFSATTPGFALVCLIIDVVFRLAKFFVETLWKIRLMGWMTYQCSIDIAV